MMLERALRLPKWPDVSFFLWGPRQTGKSTLVRIAYPEARRIDLLSSREFARFAAAPGLLREEVAAARHRFVIIDEVQKVPPLLDEVHWLDREPRLCARRRRSFSPAAAQSNGMRSRITSSAQ
ncbi:MAG: AAA family ATPase [Candidatus Binatia bacterium]